ncbi:hypothetical protein VI26_16510 [Chromobacterium sp. LK1]|uniref:c-type cytochrome n=1 Tax=Chromobacterium sp. LK1 TaxID=1628193 RepID=UPI0006543CEC|nr:cytochrome c [Chromobacterium sp. LK1]KMN32838.1 hypothetical protein VI26_16510 [Chromobacterium sp. LK1]
MDLEPLIRGAAVALLLCCGSAIAAPAAPAPERAAQLRHLVRQDCGACHGLSLGGGLGSPLTPAALKDKPDASLATVILAGRPGTPMPPWRPFLTEEEAIWLVYWLKQGAPP